MNERQPFLGSSAVPTVRPHTDRRLLNRRQRLFLRRFAAVALFLLLIFFWWAFVYTFLLAAWGTLNGIDFRAEPAFAWWGSTDWILMGLALLTVWPMQRWLRTRIAHFLDEMDNPYAIISQVSEGIATTHSADTLMENLVRLLAETLNVPYVGIETGRDGMAAEYGVPTASTSITLPLQYNGDNLGRLHICPRVVIQHFTRLQTAVQPDTFPELSERETEILKLMALELSNEAIAERLGINLKTVRNHVSNICTKLQVADRTAAILRARAQKG